MEVDENRYQNNEITCENPEWQKFHAREGNTLPVIFLRFQWLTISNWTGNKQQDNIKKAICTTYPYFHGLFAKSHTRSLCRLVSPEMNTHLLQHWSVQQKIIRLLSAKISSVNNRFWSDCRDLFSAVGFPVFPARGCKGMPCCSYKTMAIMGRASLKVMKRMHKVDSLLEMSMTTKHIVMQFVN